MDLWVDQEREYLIFTGFERGDVAVYDIRSNTQLSSLQLHQEPGNSF